MSAKIAIIDNHRNNAVIKSFSRRKDCERWLKEGLYGCDGAERDHFADMLEQLDCGNTTLHYWE